MARPKKPTTEELVESYSAEMTDSMIQFVFDYTQGFVTVKPEQVPHFREEIAKHLQEFATRLGK